MARALRIEFPGAFYHVTSRGNERKPIYADDTDRVRHLSRIAAGVNRFHPSALGRIDPLALVKIDPPADLNCGSNS